MREITKKVRKALRRRRKPRLSLRRCKNGRPSMIKAILLTEKIEIIYEEDNNFY
jgi:hypothetical protein